MIKLICPNCKEEIVIEPYIHGHCIETMDGFDFNERIYRASVKIKGYCPKCGYNIHNGIAKIISNQDIENLTIHNLNAEQYSSYSSKFS